MQKKVRMHFASLKFRPLSIVKEYEGQRPWFKKFYPVAKIDGMVFRKSYEVDVTTLKFFSWKGNEFQASVIMFQLQKRVPRRHKNFFSATACSLFRILWPIKVIWSQFFRDGKETEGEGTSSRRKKVFMSSRDSFL